MVSNVKIHRVKKYNASWNHVVIVDDTPVAIAKSAYRAGVIASYLQGLPVTLNDMTLKRELDKIMKWREAE